MLLVVLLGDDVVTTRIEPDGIIPIRLFILGSDSPESFDDVRVVSYQNVWSDASKVA